MLANTEVDDALSRYHQHLSAWQALSARSSRVDEIALALEDEAQSLPWLAFNYPKRAPAVAQLIGAYRALSARLGIAAGPGAH